MVSNLEVIKSVSKEALYFIGSLGAGVVVGAFAIPTAIRIEDKYDYYNWINTDASIWGSFLGAICGFGLCVVDVIRYSQDKEHPILTYFTIYATTNLASLFYERFRKHREKLSTSSSTLLPTKAPLHLNPSSTTSPLENKVSEKEIKPETKPKADIPNPWDIQIPPIEKIVYGGKE